MNQAQVMTDALIVKHPDVLGGKPVIAGTRITVDLILERLGEGRSITDILTEYPHLTREQIGAALEYARSRLMPTSTAAE